MDSKKKWYIGGAIIIVLILMLFVGYVKKNGGITAPKEISFGKTSGERVWYGTENGKGKDALIDYVYVTKGKKMIQYQIFDDDITLGKVSKMSNDDVIKLAKKQDRKYFNESIDEVKALRDNESQIGLQDDMMDDNDLKADLNKGAFLYFVADGKKGDKQISNVRLVDKNTYDSTNGDQYKAKFTLSELITYGAPASANESEAVDGLQHYTRTQRLNALIDNMKAVKYLAPKRQTVTVKNTTDDSGNNVVSQKVSYKSIDEFADSGTIDKNVNSLSQSSKKKIEKFWEQNYNNQKSESSSEFVDRFKSAFDSSYYHQITKGVFKPHIFDDYMTLSSITSQTIYDSKFIGYSEDDNCYLLTKAQNDNQKAVFGE
ncbi:hypothetical protein [Limosilactobacillus reuteri]